MNGIISGIKRHAIHDGDGLRTTAFLKGCPLKCIWCHNPESLSFRREVGFYQDKCIHCGSCVAACPNGAIRMKDGLPVTDVQKCIGCFACTEICPTNARISYGQEWEVEALADKLAEDKLFFESSGGGVTLSGGECLAQSEFAVELAKVLRKRGITVYIDTCGFVSQRVLEQILPFADKFLYDIKAVDPEVHKRCTGQENGLILENLRFLCRSGAAVEIRYPYVPGWNDGECVKIGEFLSELPGITKVKVLGYHGFADGKYKALGLENTLPDVTVTAHDVTRAVEILRRFGIPAVNGMLED